MGARPSDPAGRRLNGSRAEKSARPGKSVERHRRFQHRGSVREPEWRWAARKSRLWGRFRLPCPLDRSATYPLGFSGKPFATVGLGGERAAGALRSEEHTSELQSLMRISY